MLIFLTTFDDETSFLTVGHGCGASPARAVCDTTDVRSADGVFSLAEPNHTEISAGQK
jgi:hypothetical protein